MSLVATGCLSGTTTGDECGEVREGEDPRSGQHVIESGTVSYLTDPPTSGPHSGGPTPVGPLTSPVPFEIQVRLLEGGGVMISYPPDLPVSEVRRLETLAAGNVVSAPSTTPTNRIVATAWTWKLDCPTVDLDRLQTFIEQRGSDAPGRD